MKKYFDKIILNRMWIQLLLALLVVGLIAIIATPVAQYYIAKNPLDQNFHSSWLWGLLHLCDGGFIGQTISSVHDPNSTEHSNFVIFSAFFLWICGAVLFCFITSVMSNAFEVRKTLIATGQVRYSFKGNHGVVIGWDSHGATAIAAMQEIYEIKEFVILSATPSEEIREDLNNLFSPQEMAKIFIHKGNVFDKDELKKLCPWKASVVIILGDQNDNNNDGGNHRIFSLLENMKVDSPQPFPTPCFIDVGNPYSLVQDEFNLQAMLRSPKAKIKYIPLVLNFAKYSVNEVLTSMNAIQSYNTGRRTNVYEPRYRPLAFRKNPEATHVHIVIADFDDLAHMFIIQAIKVLAPSKEPHKITIFTEKTQEIKKFRNFYHLEELHGIRFNFHTGEITAPENRKVLTEIVRDISASVTLLIANPVADSALETFNRLPCELHFENIHILIEQRIMSQCVKPAYQLRRFGYATVDYVGMIDRFYYSLASREKMAWLMNALDLEDAKLFDHWRVKNSATEREDIRGFVDSILEKLYGLNLFFNKVDNESDVQPITDLKHYQEELAQAEHVRWVNTRILSGYHYEPESNDRYFASSKLVNWNDLSSDDRKQYHDSIEQIIPIVNRIFNTGNNPYTFFPQRFKLVLGIVDEGYSKQRHTAWGDESNYYFQTIIREVRRLNISTVNKKNNSRNYPSLAVCCSLAEEWSEMFVIMAMREQIPVIAILPEPPEQYQFRFAEGNARERFRQRLRYLLTYYVIPQDIPADRREQAVRELIVKHSDQVWSYKEFSHIGDWNLEFAEETPFLPKRNCSAFFRIDVENEKVLVPFSPMAQALQQE